ncbi:unnamed protein product [Protopolystoma xenopodis]|uniref:Uncharacterized protein n=1 Tax=Protopolystoma xenopodis TaxID=117903 RepID=A0A448WMS6_9PLAT|nr:unnamed protein product [Protopolystoma xenopodis]
MALRQLSSSQGPSNPEVATAITDKDQLNSVTINNSTSCAVSSSKPEHKYASELCDEKPFSSDFKTPEDSNTSSKIATASLPPLLESLNLARRAVQQSPTDGTAWSTLGNALFSYFFSTSLGPRVRITSCPTAGTELRQCLAAYAQGARDLRTALEPNFHYNRGVACHYQVIV